MKEKYAQKKIMKDIESVEKFLNDIIKEILEEKEYRKM